MTEIMWLTTGYPWEGDPVGGSFFRTQAHALARLGAKVVLVAPVPAVPWPLNRMRKQWSLYSTAPRIGMDGAVRVVRPRYLNVPGEPSWALPDRSIASAALRSRRHWASARLIHGHYAITGLAAWSVARQTQLPFFLTFHGDDMNTWPDDHPERAGDLRAAVSEARAVFAVSDALARRVREVTGVTAIPLPVGCDHDWLARTTLPRAEARRLLGLPPDLLIVLFVGYLHPQKGVRELATAILDLDEPALGVFVGEGSEHGYGLDDGRAAGRLQYQGARSHAEVIHHMAAADVLVLPSRGEGLPTVLVEAGSIGLPVIASAVGGIPELLGQDRGTILEIVSASSIQGALAHFIRHREDASSAAQRLRGHVRTEYDVTTNAHKLLAHYRSTRAARGRDVTRAAMPARTTKRGGLRIAMVLYGDLTFDSRVQREANSLAGDGHSVTIFCLGGASSTASILDPR